MTVPPDPEPLDGLPAASVELVELTAAALHTLIRGWHYDLEAASTADDGVTGRPVALDPWPAITTDSAWVARGQDTLDLATTWWTDLPADWQERFLELGREAAIAVVSAQEAGQTPAELVGDDRFLEVVGQRLGRRTWLDPPRVIGLGGGVDARPGAAGLVLAQTAVHVYAWLVSDQVRATLGTVPTTLPAEVPDRSTLIRIGGVRSEDEKYAGLMIFGDRLTTSVAERLTALIGVEPDRFHRRGDLNVQPRTGRQARPHQSGLWSISTQEDLEHAGPDLEDHLVWLLDLVEPRIEPILAVLSAHELRPRFSVYYSQAETNAEWILSAGVLVRIARLGASVWYDGYAPLG